MKYLLAPLLFVSVAQAVPHSGILSVSSGESHTCALMADHRVSCWGLGNPIPAPDADVGDVAAIATGFGFSCELRRSDKTVWCWGANSSGQLGNNSTTESATPVQVMKELTIRVVPLTNVIAVAAGSEHACALLSDNTMWCWGQNADGELGNHYSGTFSLVAVKVILNDGFDSVLNVAAMAVGSEHTCAALGDGSGTAACWGYNRQGQLANTLAGDSTSSPYPVIAPDGNKLGIYGISAGQFAAGALHTCVLVPDSMNVNSIACFGDNESGELGTTYAFGSSTSTPAPVVYPDGSKLTNLAGLSAGNFFSCAVLGTDGSIACWGLDNHGQLGNHSVTAGYSVSPVPVRLDADTLTGFTMVSAGAEHVCAAQPDGSDPAPQPGIKCWGRNDVGQLGLGVVDTFLHDTPVSVKGDWPLFTDNFGDD